MIIRCENCRNWLPKPDLKIQASPAPGPKPGDPPQRPHRHGECHGPMPGTTAEPIARNRLVFWPITEAEGGCTGGDPLEASEATPR